MLPRPSRSSRPLPHHRPEARTSLITPSPFFFVVPTNGGTWGLAAGRGATEAMRLPCRSRAPALARPPSVPAPTGLPRPGPRSSASKPARAGRALRPCEVLRTASCPAEAAALTAPSKISNAPEVSHLSRLRPPPVYPTAARRGLGASEPVQSPRPLPAPDRHQPRALDR